MKVKDIIKIIEEVAPSSYQESYDNSSLQIGSFDNEVSSVLICIDVTESVIDEAIKIGANLVISHHPLIFSGIKNIIGKNNIQKIIVKAIKNDISIYSSHTSLDNSYRGVNAMIARKLGLSNVSILDPKENFLYKLIVFTPESHVEKVKTAMFDAGAGNIGNYDCCSFSVKGEGQFKANDDASPFVGDKNSLHFEKEVRVEVIIPMNVKNQVINSMLNAHPYEEVAYDIVKLENKFYSAGSGIIGYLEQPIDSITFGKTIKSVFNSGCIKFAGDDCRQIRKVAVCGGSGSFLIKNAISLGADCFITGEIKYHDFLDYSDSISLYEAGHYETEQFTMELIKELIEAKASDLKINITEINTNPIKYL